MRRKYCECQDPTLNATVVDEWGKEFQESVWMVFIAAHGAMLFAARQDEIIENFRKDGKLPPDVDPIVEFGVPAEDARDDGFDPDSRVILSQWTHSQFLDRCRTDGFAREWATQAWLVDQFGRWESFWRARIAKAGCVDCGRRVQTSRIMNDSKAILDAFETMFATMMESLPEGSLGSFRSLTRQT